MTRIISHGSVRNCKVTNYVKKFSNAVSYRVPDSYLIWEPRAKLWSPILNISKERLWRVIPKPEPPRPCRAVAPLDGWNRLFCWMFGTKRNLPVTFTGKSHPLICLNWHTKTVEVQHYWFVTKTLEWGMWPTPHPNSCIPGKEPPYRLYRMLDALQCRSGRVWRKSL
jgi:hypothetical protein